MDPQICIMWSNESIIFQKSLFKTHKLASVYPGDQCKSPEQGGTETKDWLKK